LVENKKPTVGKRPKQLAAALGVICLLLMLLVGGVFGSEDPAPGNPCVPNGAGSYGMGVSGAGGARLAGLNERQLALARNTVAIGKHRGEPDSVIVGNLVAEITESGLRNLANKNVPESLNYPHDGVGADHTSVGPNQMLASWATQAGGMGRLMDPTYQANWFYDQADKVPGGKTMAPAELAQAVERSSANAYAGQMKLAQSVFTAVSGTINTDPGDGAAAEDVAAASGAPSSQTPAASGANPMQTAADQAVAAGHGKGLKVAIALSDPTNPSAGAFYDGDTTGTMPSASLIKLGVAVAAAIAIDDHKVDQADVAGVMRPMIVVSDNDATNALVDKLGGLSYINSTVQGLGVSGADYTMGRTVGENGGGNDPNQMSVRGAQTLLQIIYDSAIKGQGKLSKASATLIMDDLKAQNSEGANAKWDSVIPRPALAHKTGELPGSGTAHEAGFIFDTSTNKWVGVSIMTTGGTDASLATNNAVINAFGKQIFANLQSAVPGGDRAPPPNLAAAVCAPNNTLQAVGGTAAQQAVVNAALKQVGIIYAWGGGNNNGPTLGIHDGGVADAHGDYAKVGFDCSGLIQYAYWQGAHIQLTKPSGNQLSATQKWKVGTNVPTAQMQPGDLIFFGPGGGTHIQMYIGDGKIVEAPESGETVHVKPYNPNGGQVAVTRPLAGLPAQQTGAANAATNQD